MVKSTVLPTIIHVVVVRVYYMHTKEMNLKTPRSYHHDVNM